MSARARWLPVAAGLIAWAAPATADTAILQALDKILGRTSTVEVEIGKPTRFGTIEITVRACRKRPPEETPESAAFLEIDDQRPGEDKRRIFTGWMFASSPAVSALEHPVYDVWVKDCRK